MIVTAVILYCRFQVKLQRTGRMTDDSTDPEWAEANRVNWRSRRGMLELDLLLRPFARDCYLQLDADLRAAYRQLLDCDDQDIWSWLQGASSPPTDLERVIASIAAFNGGRHAHQSPRS
jgi:antitoxin CptB